MLGHVAAVRADRADQGKPGCLWPEVGHRAGQVPAVRLANEKERFITDRAVNEAQQEVQHIVVAVERRVSRGAAHPRQVRIQAAEPGDAAEHRFQAAGNLPVVHARAVQRKDGCSAAVLNEMDGLAADHRFHPASVNSAGNVGPGSSLPGSGAC